MASNRKLRTLLTGIRDGTLIPRPEFQRRLVWSNKDKRSFLRTVLMNYPFPEIYIAAGDVNPETGEGTEMLVDGQQRITTLFQYFTGAKELPLAKEITPYAKLDQKDKIAFLEYAVVVRDLGKKTIEEIKEIFQRINSTSYSLNAMEIKNARYDGEFKQFGEHLAENNFFESHRVFNTRDIRRMGDVLFCLTYVATMMSSYFNRDDELETYLERYNEEFDARHDIERDILLVFDIVDKCDFDPESRVWKKGDLLTLLVEVHRTVVRRIAIRPESLGNVLKDFYARVDAHREQQAGDPDVANYYRASIQATNDRSSRIKRGEIIQKLVESSVQQQQMI